MLALFGLLLFELCCSFLDTGEVQQEGGRKLSTGPSRQPFTSATVTYAHPAHNPVHGLLQGDCLKLQITSTQNNSDSTSTDVSHTKHRSRTHGTPCFDYWFYILQVTSATAGFCRRSKPSLLPLLFTRYPPALFFPPSLFKFNLRRRATKPAQARVQ